MRKIMDKEYKLTEHARVRCQQRGIPETVVKFIISHGESLRTHQDRKFYINKKRMNELKHSNKAFFIKHDKHLINTAVVCNEEKKTVITAMKIERSLRWN